MEELEGVIETRSNALIALASGEPERESVLVEWDETNRVNVRS